MTAAQQFDTEFEEAEKPAPAAAAVSEKEVVRHNDLSPLPTGNGGGTKWIITGVVLAALGFGAYYYLQMTTAPTLEQAASQQPAVIPPPAIPQQPEVAVAAPLAPVSPAPENILLPTEVVPPAPMPVGVPVVETPAAPVDISAPMPVAPAPVEAPAPIAVPEGGMPLPPMPVAEAPAPIAAPAPVMPTPTVPALSAPPVDQAIPATNFEMPAAPTPASVAAETIPEAVPAPAIPSAPVVHNEATEQRISQLETNFAQLKDKVASKEDVENLQLSIGRIQQILDERPLTPRAPVITKPTVADVVEAAPKKTVKKAVSKPAVKKESKAKAKPAPATNNKVWVLKSAKPGMAWIAPQGSSAIKTVMPGDAVEGLGTIRSITKDSQGRWAVIGTRGQIFQ